jgi:hypothetical protein
MMHVSGLQLVSNIETQYENAKQAVTESESQLRGAADARNNACESGYYIRCCQQFISLEVCSCDGAGPPISPGQHFGHHANSLG